MRAPSDRPARAASSRRIYLDHNASAPLHPLARAAMREALDLHGNASSVHEEGRRAREIVEQARDAVARLVGGDRFGVVFTSGGTEADLLGITGLARASGRKRILCAAVEHPAARGAVEALAATGHEVIWLPVDGAGRLRLDRVADALAAGDVACVVAQLANHETGVLQDVAAVAHSAARHGVPVFCDAVQAAGKVPVDVERLGVAGLALSAHKIGGPKGAGALWIRPGTPFEPLVPGAHQERGLRGGTENVAAIAGLGAAAAVALTELLPAGGDVATRRDRLERALLARMPGCTVLGAGAPRVPNTTCLAVGAPGDVVVAALDLEGIAASSGAACTSGRVAPSAVLVAMGLGAEEARRSLRLSLGPGTVDDEVDRVVDVVPAVVARIRAAGLSG